MHGSRQVLRQQITRSLLIEEILKAEVDDKSAVIAGRDTSLLRRNPERFQNRESFNIQSISFLPPQKPTPEMIEQEPKTCGRSAASGQSHQQLRRVWTAGGKNLRR